MKVVPPNSTIGVLGSGQLGRMFTMAARRMGYLVHTFSPETDTPTGQIADLEITAAYEDFDAVRRFAAGVDVVTFEFENIPIETIEVVNERVPVRPGGRVLHTTQHRVREKTFLSRCGFPVTPFRRVTSGEDLMRAIDELGTPCVLKTADWGYDGKGQRKIDSREDAPAAFRALNCAEAVLEKFINLECEISVVAARGSEGEVVSYEVSKNDHSRHILDTSITPAPVAPEIAARATEIAVSVVEELGVVGVLCVEFFLARDGGLYVNELAPRPHNSGHWTVDACVTSQFEQQLRAVCDLPLGAVRMLQPAAAMVNLLGDLWAAGEPDWATLCAMPEVKLHLYGKRAARLGRKMGHLTALAGTSGRALEIVLEARGRLTKG
ncbi:MAG: 5-(carboxyamino)imidazole ribonucleotide synthase [Pyrinomonadaceae bacterium]|nr:5-(carboxyamino)imidazole ribonucleotide synthase [Pyrinomonadaceae bacterium]